MAHDKSALFFGYGVKSHQTVSRFSHWQNRMRDERPLVVDERPYSREYGHGWQFDFDFDKQWHVLEIELEVEDEIKLLFFK